MRNKIYIYRLNNDISIIAFYSITFLLQQEIYNKFTQDKNKKYG